MKGGIWGPVSFLGKKTYSEVETGLFYLTTFPVANRGFEMTPFVFVLNSVLAPLNIFFFLVWNIVGLLCCVSVVKQSDSLIHISYFPNPFSI